MSKRKWKVKYLAGLLTAALTVAGAAAIPGYAARQIETERSCSLTMSVGEEGSYREDLESAVWEVSLYRIASVDDAGVYTGTEGFESVAERFSSVETAEELEDLSAEAAEIIAGQTEPAEAAAVITVENGSGTAEGLETGLYLALSENARTEYYEYTFQPSLVTLPGPQDESGWTYDAAAVLKPERNPRYGSLRVVKTLDSYNESLGPVTFVFQIEGTDDAGQVVYSNVVATTHSSAGVESAVAEHIPAGTHVTVTEVYSGASYELTSSGTDMGVIAADEELSMEFSNTYNEELVPGYGAVNHFEYDENSGWQWERISGNAEDAAPGTDEGSGQDSDETAAQGNE